MKRLIREYGWEAVLTVIAFVALSLIFHPQGFTDLIGGLWYHLTILFLAIVLGGVLGLFGISKEIGLLLNRHRSTNSKIRRPLALFFQDHILALHRLRDELVGNHGLELGLDDLKKFVGACFAANRKKSYVGTDSSVPTVFYQLYPTYLDQQFVGTRSTNPGRDVRILLSSETELQEDFQRDRVVVSDFYNSHIIHHVRLLQVNKDTAKKLAQNHRLPSTDMGIFGPDFVVFFTPLLRSGTPVKYRIQMTSLELELRLSLQQYFRMLNQNAKEIRLENGIFFCGSRDGQTMQVDEERLLWCLSDHDNRLKRWIKG